MNELAHTRFSRQPTQGAEGLPRWRWSLAEFDKMIESGLLSEDDRVELIEGELVPMAAKGNRHEALKSELVDWLFLTLPKTAKFTVELGWRPDGNTYVEPDIFIYPRGLTAPAASPADALLVMEVADTSLRYDRGLKAKVYARLGVREYWVIDANTLETTVHLSPTAEGYASVTTHAPDAALTPTLLPALALSLGGLALG